MRLTVPFCDFGASSLPSGVDVSYVRLIVLFCAFGVSTGAFLSVVFGLLAVHLELNSFTLMWTLLANVFVVWYYYLMEFIGLLMLYVNGTATTYGDLTLVGKRLFGLFFFDG